MNSVNGVTRAMDGLGRVTIPKEMCKELKANTGSVFDIYLFGNNLILSTHCEDLICNTLPLPLVKETLNALSGLSAENILLCINIIKRFRDSVQQVQEPSPKSTQTLMVIHN